MLQQLLHILVISFVCCSWGLLPLLLLTRTGYTAWYRSGAGLIAFLFLLGCMTLGLLSSWLYLIVPLHFGTLLTLTALQLLFTVLIARGKLTRILSSLPSPVIRVRGLPLFFFLACLGLFLLLGSLPPANPDTGIYHLQIIEWAFSHPAVPGIVNLFPRLGLGSNWLLLIGFFHIPWLGHENFSYLNTSLVIWLFVWLFHQWHYHWHNRNSTSSRMLGLFYFLLLIFSLFEWQMFRNAANSTSYDPIVTTCLLLALCFWTESIIPEGKEPEPSPLFVFITLSALGFKLSGFFIVILLAYHLFRHRRRLTYLVFTALSFLLIVTPVLVKNYIITGYPMFPLPFATGSPDWKLPQGMADLFSNYIVLSNRFYNSPFINSFAFRQQHSAWVAQWFAAIEPQHKMIILLSIVSMLLVLFKKKWPVHLLSLRMFMLLLFLMETAWFLTAPNPRFSYATLLCTAFLPISILVGDSLRNIPYRIGLAIATCSVILYIPGKTRAGFEAHNFLYPSSFKGPADDPLSINGPAYHHPATPAHGYKCLLGTLPLPCTCQTNPFLQPRGMSLSDGFRMDPTPDSAFVEQYNY